MHQEFEPPEELSHAIKCFWYDRSDYPPQQTSFEVMPDGYSEIIFHFGSGCSVLRDGILQSLPSPFMMGLLSHPCTLYTQNRFEIIGIRCFPWTVFDLLGLSSVKEGVHTFEHPVADLQPSLNTCILAGNIKEVVALVERYFLDAISQIPLNSMLFKAGVAMQKAKGNIPVSEVASSAHATVRTLERKFKESSGHTVKDVSGLMRFEQARNHLWHNPNTNLAGLAMELGYTDQSHLSKEFKRYSGTTPAAFAKRAKRQFINTDFLTIKPA